MKNHETRLAHQSLQLTILLLLSLPLNEVLAAPKNIDKSNASVDFAETEKPVGYLPAASASLVYQSPSLKNTEQKWEAIVRNLINNQAAITHATGTEEFEILNVEHDQFGQTHIRAQEKLAGLPVVGGDIVIHANTLTGNVQGIGGRFLPDTALNRIPNITSDTAFKDIITKLQGQLIDTPQLTYVLDNAGKAHLSWSAKIQYTNAEGLQIDQVFIDTNTRKLVARHPQIHRAMSRYVYSANNGTTLPGTLKRREGQAAVSDSAINNNYSYLGNVYSYYYNVHGRDSYDGNGAILKSSLHYASAYNNAFWNGTQMVYGDGDGSTFTILSNSLDVTSHELTHAVTQKTAGLIYSNESGALNEATSDILAAANEAYTKNSGTPNSNTWKIGEDIYTPRTSGDALRYMNNPTQDGSSKDYYPERYTGTSDNGGVHSNSGIANLAFYMMTMGGTHPRGKTSIAVPALSSTPSTSLTMASKIWYRALKQYFTSTTNFSTARTATMTAANDLYGANAKNTVDKAWQAVGVGTIASCKQYSGYLYYSNDVQYQPNGTYYQSTASGTHRAQLKAAANTDFDLYLYKWNGSSWVEVASSEKAYTSSESISYTGSAGYYTWEVYSFYGSGSYSLCLAAP
ncbi:MAG: hypothetical protein RI964_1834 [Pseudomonadota bacterium]|jgi:vibriolysin